MKACESLRGHSALLVSGSLVGVFSKAVSVRPPHRVANRPRRSRLPGMDDTDSAPITDPASVLIGLGAVCGLIAAGMWLSVVRNIASRSKTDQPPRWSIVSSAATFTALSLGLASAGYLLGRLMGRF